MTLLLVTSRCPSGNAPHPRRPCSTRSQPEDEASSPRSCHRAPRRNSPLPKKRALTCRRPSPGTEPLVRSWCNPLAPRGEQSSSRVSSLQSRLHTDGSIEKTSTSSTSAAADSCSPRQKLIEESKRMAVAAKDLARYGLRRVILLAPILIFFSLQHFIFFSGGEVEYGRGRGKRFAVEFHQ